MWSEVLRLDEHCFSMWLPQETEMYFNNLCLFNKNILATATHQGGTELGIETEIYKIHSFLPFIS